MAEKHIRGCQITGKMEREKCKPQFILIEYHSLGLGVLADSISNEPVHLTNLELLVSIS